MDTTTAAIVATVIMCMHGTADENNKCPDGSEMSKVDVTILKGTLRNLDICKTFSDAWADPDRCVNSWDSILEVTKDGKLLFQLKFDGTTVRDPSFSPDAGAVAFGKAFDEIVKQRLEGIKDFSTPKPKRRI